MWGLLLCPLLVLFLAIGGLLIGAWLQSLQPDQAPQRPLIPPDVEAAMRDRSHMPGEQEGIQEAPSPQVRQENGARE